jgi:hypothetical protein
MILLAIINIIKINCMRINVKIITIISVFLFQSCGAIWICKETKYNFKNSDKYNNLTNITIDELKQLIVSDTSHYKVLILYSPCCGPCTAHMEKTYKEVYNNNSSVKFYFVNESCGGLNHVEEFINYYGYKETLYYIKDSSKNYKWNNIERYNNIINYLFEENTSKKITGTYGIPISCVISKDNKLKKMLCHYSNESDTIYRYIPLPLHSIGSQKIKEIDYVKIDSINILKYEYCTPKGCILY